MKLLYVTVSMPFGPAESFFIPEVHEMLRQGCEMLIVPRSPTRTCVNRNAEALQKHCLRMSLLNVQILLAALAAFLRHPIRVLRALSGIARGGSLATIAKNLSVFPKALWLAGVAKSWGADHIHAQWALTTATMGMVASELSGIPWSCTAHRGDILDNNLLAVKLTRASFMRFIAKDGIAIAESLCGRPLPGNVVLLHSCVDMPEKIVFRETLHSPPVLICPAFLSERKGHKYLIEAVRLLRDSGMKLTVLIAGDGEALPILKAQVLANHLEDSVTFVGLVEHGRLLEMFRTGEVDIVVLPTLHEGIPAGLIEPMGYGVPVISTSVGGIPELLDGDAGIMVPPADAQSLADGIRRLITDPDLRRRMVANGRRRVEQGWAVQPVVEELLRLLSAHSKNSPVNSPCIQPRDQQ